MADNTTTTTFFRLTGDAKPYIKRLEQNSTTGGLGGPKGGENFVFYWLCAQIGIVFDKTKEVPSVTTDLGVRFVGTRSIEANSTFIRGMLLWRELHRYDVNPANKADLEKRIEKKSLLLIKLEEC